MTKVCTTCQETFPASADHFHRQAKGKCGLTSKCKACKATEIEAWRQKNLARHHSYKVKWRTEHREQYLDIKRRDMHKRRSAMQGESYTQEEWLALCALYDNICLACGDAELTIDHVVPLSKGGSNTIDNLQPLCRSCNSSKGAREVDYREVKDFQLAASIPAQRDSSD